MWDELIRENARLLVRQAADQLQITALHEQIENNAMPLADEQAAIFRAHLATLQKRFDEAVDVIHKLMAGAPHCDFCGDVCKMGADCRPRWKGVPK